MRCKNCEYPLWNLPGRTCPECGTPFRPSDYEFTLNSVQFRCPHCAQSYYGTGARGHLVPDTFDCVSCGRTITMDEMVLLPTAGVEEERTRVEEHPWLERARFGRVKSWFRTLGMALFMPGRLARLGGEDKPGEAFSFACITNAIYIAAFCALFFVLILFMAFVPGSRGGGGGALGPLLGFGGFAIGALVSFLVLVGVWGAISHGILALTGGTLGGVSRTYSSICYASAANVLVAVPCIGPYLFPIGLVWWLVAAIIMLRHYQGVPGWRASLALIPVPLVLLAGIVAMVFLAFNAAFAVSQTLHSSTVDPRLTARPVAAALVSYPGGHGDAWPAHGAGLVADGLSVNSFVHIGSSTNVSGVRVGATTLTGLDVMSDSEKAQAIALAASTLPKNVVAHRVGDFVFTYHGFPGANPDARLWIAVLSLDPVSNPGSGPANGAVGAVSGKTVTPYADSAAILSDGSVIVIRPELMASMLVKQNEVRAELGLPPLPDPATVTDTKPATSGP